MPIKPSTKYGKILKIEYFWSLTSPLLYKKANKVLALKKNFTVHCGMAIGYENKRNKINTLVTQREKIDNFCKFLN